MDPAQWNGNAEPSLLPPLYFLAEMVQDASVNPPILLSVRRVLYKAGIRCNAHACSAETRAKCGVRAIALSTGFWGPLLFHFDAKSCTSAPVCRVNAPIVTCPVGFRASGRRPHRSPVIPENDETRRPVTFLRHETGRTHIPNPFSGPRAPPPSSISTVRRSSRAPSRSSTRPLPPNCRQRGRVAGGGHVRRRGLIWRRHVRAHHVGLARSLCR